MAQSASDRKYYERGVKPGCKAPNDGLEYSREDDKTIRRMSQEGKTDIEIGKAVGHTGHAIGQRRYFVLGIGKKPLPAPTVFWKVPRSDVHRITIERAGVNLCRLQVYCPEDTILFQIEVAFVTSEFAEYWEQWKEQHVRM